MNILLIAALAAAAVQTADAPDPQSLAGRIAEMPKDAPRARGPGMAYALHLAQAAVEACKAREGSFSVLVTDSAAVPIVSIASDGAGERSQLIGRTKAYTVARYRMDSGTVKRKARADPQLARELALDPDIGEARFGAFPLMKGDELIGVLSISGQANGGDEECAKQAMAKVPLP